MAMHTRKTYQRDSGRFSVKRRALLRLRTEKRAEGLSGGAGKGCYGKSLWDRQKSPDGVTLEPEKTKPRKSCHILADRMITRARSKP